MAYGTSAPGKPLCSHHVLCAIFLMCAVVAVLDSPRSLPRTYSLCSPRQGAGMRKVAGVLDNFAGNPGYW